MIRYGAEVRHAWDDRHFRIALAHRRLCGRPGATHGGLSYPNPSSPMIEAITQYEGWPAALPLELALQRIPGLTDIRSRSIFELSDSKIYFDFETDYFRDRQEIPNRLRMITLPKNTQPTISP